MSIGKKAIATAPNEPTVYIDLTEEERSLRAAEEGSYQDVQSKNSYKEKRLEAYPSIVDQLDQIYHEGIDAWKATIKAIKDTYPKSS